MELTSGFLETVPLNPLLSYVVSTCPNSCLRFSTDRARLVDAIPAAVAALHTLDAYSTQSGLRIGIHSGGQADEVGLLSHNGN